MDWVTALCTSTGCTVDGAATTLNPLSDWIENWTRLNLGRSMNINTPQNATAVVNVMSEYSLNSEEKRVVKTLENSLNVMEHAWSQAQKNDKVVLTPSDKQDIMRKVDIRTKRESLFEAPDELDLVFQIETWRKAIDKVSKGYSLTKGEIEHIKLLKKNLNLFF